MNVFIFTPTWLLGGQPAMRPECRRSIEAQIIASPWAWVIGTDNPWPTGDYRNVLHQYQQAREMFLAGEHQNEQEGNREGCPDDVFITIEHDHELPDAGALQRMIDTPGDVVYAPYMLRHGPPNLVNLYRFVDQTALGTSLSHSPDELAQARAANVWRVSGAGFGCTLFRREVIEAIPFAESDERNACPDLGFATAALKAGYVSMARMDVPVRHRWLGSWWDPWGQRMTEPDNSDLVDGQWQRDFWLGHEQWQCVTCRWDTLSGIDAARARAAKCLRCHPPIEEKMPSPILTADRRGREIRGG